MKAKQYLQLRENYRKLEQLKDYFFKFQISLAKCSYKADKDPWRVAS